MKYAWRRGVAIINGTTSSFRSYTYGFQSSSGEEYELHMTLRPRSASEVAVTIDGEKLEPEFFKTEEDAIEYAEDIITENS